MRRAAALAATATVALLAWSPAAGAAVTIGYTPPVQPLGNCSSSDNDYFQTAVASAPGTSYVVPPSPYGAVITSWSHWARAVEGQRLGFKVFRKVAEPSTYMVVAHDGPRPMVSGAINTFPVDIEVAAGDIIGIDSGNAADTVVNSCSVGTGDAGDDFSYRGPGLADGASGTYFGSDQSLINISAVVKPSNRFTLAGLTRNRKTGRAAKSAVLPGPGTLAVAGTGLRSLTVGVSAPGTYAVPIVPQGKLRKKLRKRGKAKAAFTVTFTPEDGDAASQPAGAKLKQTP